MKLKVYLFSAVLIFINHFLYGQFDTGNQNLDEVTITATRNPGANLNLPYIISTLRDSAIKQQLPRSLPEALIGVPGVFVQRTNHGGGSPFIRGLTGNQTLTLIDGIRLNNSTFRYGPNQYLNTIDLFTIDKIEVAKGTGSVQYGSDALGGVIQVFTKDPVFNDKPQLNGKVLGKYMTHDMEKTLRGELQFGSQKFAVMAGYSFKKFGDLWGGDTTARQSPSGYNENAFDIKLKYALPKNWLLKAAHQTLIQTDVPVYHKVKLENYAISKMHPQLRHLSYLNLEKYFSNPHFEKLLITLSDHRTGETRINQKNGSVTQTKEKDDINTLGFAADIAHRFNKYWRANTGIEFYFDKVSSTKTEINTAANTIKDVRGLYPDDSKYANLSFYSLHHLQFNSWIFEGGLRYNTFSITINDTTLGKVVTHPAAWVMNAGVLKKLNAQNSLYFNYSNGFRSPNIDDMGTLGIVDFRYEQPAYNLKPERSDNFELGYKLLATKVAANIAIFYNGLQNLITRQKIDGQMINGYNVYQKVNNEKAYIWGTDIDLELSILKNLKARVATSYAFGQNITKNEPLRRVPPMNKRVLVNYHKEKWYAKAEWLNAKKQDRLAQGDKDDNRIPSGGTPGWNVFNLYGGYYLKSILLNAGVQNIFNEDYRYHGSGINGVGRSAWVAVQLSF